MNLSEIPPWAWAVAAAAFGAVVIPMAKYFIGGKVSNVDSSLSGLKQVAKEQYEDNEERRIDIKDVEIRVLIDQRDEARRERDILRGKQWGA